MNGRERVLVVWMQWWNGYEIEKEERREKGWNIENRDVWI